MTDLPPIHFTDYVIEPGEIDYELWYMNHYRRPDGLKKLHAQIKQEEEAVRQVLELAKGERSWDALNSISSSVATLRRYTGLAKVQGYVQLLKDELESGKEKQVIFAVHRDVIRELQLQLRDYNPVFLYGGTPAEKRQKAIDKFTKKSKHRLFIGQVIAAGTAINLTVAHHVDFLEADWVPGNNAQAAMRCHRIGQDKPVTVRFIGLANSLDEHIQRRLRRKAETLAQIFD